MTGTDGPRQQLAAALHSVGYRGTESAVTALLPVVTAWAEQQRDALRTRMEALADEWERHPLWGDPVDVANGIRSALTAGDPS
jgi:hypothetical protein